MYNLPVPKLCATLLADPLSAEATDRMRCKRGNERRTVLYGGLNSELV